MIEKDQLETSMGPVVLGCLGHGSLMLEFQQLVIHVDPYSKVADYSTLAKADLILLTHAHADHLDQKAMKAVSTEKSEIIMPPVCAAQGINGFVLKNGEGTTFHGITIKAVPAYNLVHKRENGEPYHPKGVGNGYLLGFGDTCVYIAGDTENIEEMKALPHIDCAFLPMNLPYTMTPEMVAEAARSIHPTVLYPYHFGDTDPQRLVELLADTPAIEVRIRQMS